MLWSKENTIPLESSFKEIQYIPQLEWRPTRPNRNWLFFYPTHLPPPQSPHSHHLPGSLCWILVGSDPSSLSILTPPPPSTCLLQLHMKILLIPLYLHACHLPMTLSCPSYINQLQLPLLSNTQLNMKCPLLLSILLHPYIFLLPPNMN